MSACVFSLAEFESAMRIFSVPRELWGRYLRILSEVDSRVIESHRKETRRG